MHWAIIIGGVILLIAFPRQFLAIIFLMIVAAVFGVIMLMDNNQKQTERQQKIAQTVKITARYDPTSCSADFPMHVTVQNNNTNRIMRMTFSIIGFREGYSNPVFMERAYSSDRIIAPGHEYVACWTLPARTASNNHTPPQLARFVALYSHGTFAAPATSR